VCPQPCLQQLFLKGRERAYLSRVHNIMSLRHAYESASCQREVITVNSKSDCKICAFWERFHHGKSLFQKGRNLQNQYLYEFCLSCALSIRALAVLATRSWRRSRCPSLGRS
jgi:hypothetical protein